MNRAQKRPPAPLPGHSEPRVLKQVHAARHSTERKAALLFCYFILFSLMKHFNNRVMTAHRRVFEKGHRWMRRKWMPVKFKFKKKKSEFAEGFLPLI